MDKEDMHTSELEFDPNKTNLEGFIERILPVNTSSDDDEIFSVALDTAIDATIDKIEKILHLEALSDDEWAELYASDTELQDDIDILDFDDTDY